MDKEEIDAILAEDDRAWAELTAVLDANPDVNLHAPGSKPWTSRDVYAHLAKWLDYNAIEIQSILAGNPVTFPGKSVEEVNARWEAENASLSLDEARRRARDAYEARKRVVASIPPSRWDEKIEKSLHIEGANHFREHLSYITPRDA